VSITDVNVVRRHLSRIKGGGLARVAADHARRTVVVSDVIGGAAHDVGSGPSVSDPTTIEDARHVAHRFSFGELPWVETWKHPEQAFICADPEAFALLVREELERRGLRDVTATAVEPVLDIPPNAGRGGRCTHAAALASLTLQPGTLFAALATDGVDGTSGTGGAIVLGPVGTPDQTREALARFDTGALHLAAGTAVPGGPTGLNFADLHVTARYGPSTALRTS
jgi:hydroxypyruvate reductase